MQYDLLEAAAAPLICTIKSVENNETYYALIIDCWMIKRAVGFVVTEDLSAAGISCKILEVMGSLCSSTHH